MKENAEYQENIKVVIEILQLFHDSLDLAGEPKALCSYCGAAFESFALVKEHVPVCKDNPLVVEIKRLQEIEQWIEEVRTAQPQHPDDERRWIPAMLDAKHEIKRLQKVLGWYADTKNYEEDFEDAWCNGPDGSFCEKIVFYAIVEDGGEKARKALESK